MRQVWIDKHGRHRHKLRAGFHGHIDGHRFARTQANIFFRHPVRLQRLAIAGKQRRVVSIVERLPVLQLINTHHRRQGGAFGVVIHAFPGAKIQMQGFHLGVKNGLGHGNGTVFHGLRQSAAG